MNEHLDDLRETNLRFKNVKKIEGLINLAKEINVIFYDFRFTDIKGTWHHISYYVDAIDEDSFKNGLPFDGSSIPAWQPIDKSDMILKPDFKSAFVDPFFGDTTLVIFCDIYDIYNKEPYRHCPRSIAKKSLEHLIKSGVGDTVYFGPENEFFIFDDIKVRDTINSQYYELDSVEGEWNSDKEIQGGNLGHRPGTKGGYFPCSPVDTLVEIRADIVKHLQAIGLKIFVVHHEVGQSQNEIGVQFATLVEAADNVQKLKYVVKKIAHEYDKTATFMPKPLDGDNGSGMHIHFSIWKKGENLFYGDKYQNLSQTALSAIGGVLHHARSIASFTNASTNSYKRLIPGFEAPSILTYSAQNRSASCRIPYGGNEKSKRVEFRFPDSSSNPYLAFSSVLMAALDGIENKIDPGEPRDENLFKLTLDEIREKNIPQMPHTLRGSLESLLRDKDFYKKGEVFTEDFLQNYKNYKFETEVWPWEGKPHPLEFISTYSC